MSQAAQESKVVPVAEPAAIAHESQVVHLAAPVEFAASLPAAGDAGTRMTIRNGVHRRTQSTRTSSSAAGAPYSAQREVPVWQCSMCNNNFSSKQRLQSHQARACKAAKPDQYSKCEQCGKRVKTSHLAKHQKSASECAASTHKQTTRVQCQWCPASLLPTRSEHHIKYECVNFKEECRSLDFQERWCRFRLAQMTPARFQIPPPDHDMTEGQFRLFCLLVFQARTMGDAEFRKRQEAGVTRLMAGQLLHQLMAPYSAWPLLEPPTLTADNVDRNLALCEQKVYAAALPAKYLDAVCCGLAQLTEYELTVDSSLQAAVPTLAQQNLMVGAPPTMLQHSVRGQCRCFYCLKNVPLPLDDLKKDRAYMRRQLYRRWLDNALALTDGDTERVPPPIPTEFTYRSTCCPRFLFCEHSFREEDSRVKKLALYLYGRGKSKPARECFACAGKAESIEHVAMDCPLYADLREQCTKELDTYDADFSLALVVGDGYEYIDRDDEQRAAILSVAAGFLLEVICKRESERVGLSEPIGGNPFHSHRVLTPMVTKLVHGRIVVNCAKLGIILA